MKPKITFLTVIAFAIAGILNAQNPTMWWKLLEPGTYASNNDLGGATNLQNRIPDFAFFIDPSAYRNGTAADPGKANYKTYPNFGAASGINASTGADANRMYSQETINGELRDVLKVNDDVANTTITDVKASNPSKVPGVYGTGARTLCFWMKLNATACDINSSWSQIMVLGSTSFTAAENYINLSLEMLPGSRDLKMRTGSVGFQSNAASIEDDTWYFVAIRNPDSPNFSDIELVIDASTVLSPPSSLANDVPVDIAATGGAFFFRQKVQGFSFADVRIYNQYIPNSQLKQIANFPVYSNITIDNGASGYVITNDDDNDAELYVSLESYADDVIKKSMELVATNGKITLNTGTYTTENTINLISDITIQGVDTTAVIKKILPGHVIVGNGVENVMLKKLKILSSISFESQGNGIFLEDASSFNTIDSCVVRNVSGHGIFIVNPTSNYNVVSNNKVSDCNGNTGIAFQNKASHATITGNEVKRTKTHGILIGSGSNTVILNNHVEDSGFYRPANAVKGEFFCHGIAIGGNALLATGTRAGNHLIQNNTVINSGRAGIEVADFNDNAIIDNNYIHTTGLYTNEEAQDQYGIYFGGSLGNGINGTITNNVIYDAKKDGIKVGSNNTSIAISEQILVEGNSIYNAAEEGIKIMYADHVTVQNNSVKNTTFNGLKLNGGTAGNTPAPASNIVISSNDISSSLQYGISLSNGNVVSVTNNNLCSNTLGGINQGSGLSGLSISGNSCVLGLEDFEASEVLMYPNPFNNNLFLENLNKVSNLKIYTIIGQLIYSKSLNGQDKLNINTSYFASGLYILNLQNETRYIQVKLLKNKLL